MSIVDSIESALIESAETRNFENVSSLLERIVCGEPVSGLIARLDDAATLAFDNSKDLDKGALDVALQIAFLGSAPTKLRDFFADSARKVFNTYPDPAGLVKALGCHESQVTPAKMAANWHLLSVLLSEYGDSSLTGVKKTAQSTYCYTAKFGFGKVEDVDAFGNQVSVTFKALQSLSLEKFVELSCLVLPGSKALDLLEGKRFDYKAILAKDLANELEKDLLPGVKFTQAVLTKILMPKYIKSVKAFESWYTRKSLLVAEKSAQSGVRNWGNSRSLAELVEHLPKDKVAPNEEQEENLIKIFKFSASKDSQVSLYSETMCIFWAFCKSKDSMDRIIDETGPISVVWQSREVFLQVTDKMMAKHLNSWFHIIVQAKGSEWLVENCLDLPFKFWSYIETALEDIDALDQLVRAVRKQIKTGRIGADSLIWMWQKYKKDHDFLFDIIGSPSLVIRTLARDVCGNYIKASKDLRKLICENEAFQRFLMNNGEATAISALVSATRSMAGLGGGEKQSLLIRVVRLYPESKHLVEERKVTISTDELEIVTSVRSFKEKQLELIDLVSVQLPQNRDAIATAKEYGDLRENFEFKAAKEHKGFLDSRRKELETMLNEIKPTDFTEFTVKDRAIVGSVVTVSSGKGDLVYTILGMWDSEPEKGYISFETPLGKVLIGRQVGDTVTLPTGEAATINSITALPKDLLKSLAG
jgi:transcription elongation GreA/GreB family factor